MSHKANEATAPLFPQQSCWKQWCSFLNGEYYLWLPKTELQPNLTTRARSERSPNTPHVPWSSTPLIMLTFVQVSFTTFSFSPVFFAARLLLKATVTVVFGYICSRGDHGAG